VRIAAYEGHEIWSADVVPMIAAWSPWCVDGVSFVEWASRDIHRFGDRCLSIAWLIPVLDLLRGHE